MGRLEYTKPNNSVTLEWNWKKCFKWDCVISFVPYNRRSNDYQLMGSAEYRSQDAPPPPPHLRSPLYSVHSSFVAVIQVIIPLHSRDKFLEPEPREGSY